MFAEASAPPSSTMQDFPKPSPSPMLEPRVQPPAYQNPAFKLEERELESGEHYASVQPRSPQTAHHAMPTHTKEDPEHVILPAFHNSELDKEKEVQFEDDGRRQFKVFALISKSQNAFSLVYQQHRKSIGRGIKILFLVGFIVYFGFAMSYAYGRPPFPVPNPNNIFEANQGLALFLLTLIVVVFIVWDKMMLLFGNRLGNRWEQFAGNHRRIVTGIRWFILTVIVVLIAVFLGLDVGRRSPENFISLLGLFVFILAMFICSVHPGRVRWTPVFGGCLLQFVLALFVLRTKFGFDLFEFLGSETEHFLSYSNVGSSFLFGELVEKFLFAFLVLPIVVFFSAIVGVLFYFGAIQYITLKLAWIMSATMETTAAESLSVAANIFLGPSESCLLITPFLNTMTASELHAVMVGSFATVAGSTLGAYISFGVPSNHLIAASVMTAPAALVAAKLLYPETKKSLTTWNTVQKMPRPPDKNVIEAISNGANQSIALVAGIAVNLIAFLAILAFLNATTSWLFGNVQHPEITFEKLMAWVFYPVAWLMGVTTRDSMVVGELLGIKTFLNEFIAYQKLGKMVKLRDTFMNGTISTLSAYNGTDPMIYDDRSIVIATYALCGFSNFGSIGIQLGSLVALAPHRSRTLASTVVRAMIAGNIACFMAACMAGLLYQEKA